MGPGPEALATAARPAPHIIRYPSSMAGSLPPSTCCRPAHQAVFKAAGSSSPPPRVALLLEDANKSNIGGARGTGRWVPAGFRLCLRPADP